MKGFKKLCFITILLAVIFACIPASLLYASDHPSIEITNWEIMWEDSASASALDTITAKQERQWVSYSYGDELPEKPTDVNSVWLRFQLPSFNLDRPALLINELISKDVQIYINEKLVYGNFRDYPYNKNEVLLPLNDNEANSHVYILLNTERDWVGLKGKLILGEYKLLEKEYLKRDFLDVILGAALIFISIGMFVSVVFLNKTFQRGWQSLSAVILSIGVMILTYSSVLQSMYPEYGKLSYHLFDIASNLLMPSIYFFFEKIFGKGPIGLVSKFRKIQVILALLSIMMLLGSSSSEVVEKLYYIVGIFYFGVSIILGNILLVTCLVMYCIKGNKEAVILAFGFGVFALIGAGEVTWYFVKDMGYDMFLWKWGSLSFITSLVVILVRRMLLNYEQVINYSQQVEVFNNELQRSEKMDIISQLAASVAHEVRNPLQVTRGFLQLLGEKSAFEKDKAFMGLAIEELDRASDIITDFLTFAKPQMEQVVLLNIEEELRQIEVILAPLATMQGGTLYTDISTDLFVNGNSSKFKQALINIIKNSIEALNQNGEIVIRASKDTETNKVKIHIIDNGEGMSETDLKRLGEPYYSNKSKGTGLGLMVTFRIIEIMEGKLEFYSKKGSGTEAVIYLPVANK
ncbi:signal transduction histidine kinase [Paenibacillus endophyticus]|uniref:histidine kinase n=1 Tax=Paenibacillus endophyticus TaxID=1294268 RepID=A0A7W5GA45_9BACL|nr:HAMP domain-containing sensor histidine kinase [Paenibacillus endophyticus]MBB3152380.1 signal transduction histidine kinase [Paenibacillus endophyticus]